MSKAPVGKKHTVASGKRSAAAILDAADEVLAEVGFDAMSMRAVAERAGVNKALVFYHYGNKAQLFEYVLERYYHAHQDALAGALGEAGSSEDRLHSLIDVYFDFIDENRRYARLIQHQVSSAGAAELIKKNLAPFYKWTESILSEFLPTDGPLAARHFYITFSGMVINYFTYGPLLAEVWGSDPMSPANIEERREHLHWMADKILEGVQRT